MDSVLTYFFIILIQSVYGLQNDIRSHSPTHTSTPETKPPTEDELQQQVGQPIKWPVNGLLSSTYENQTVNVNNRGFLKFFVWLTVSYSSSAIKMCSLFWKMYGDSFQNSSLFNSPNLFPSNQYFKAHTVIYWCLHYQELFCTPELWLKKWEDKMLATLSHVFPFPITWSSQNSVCAYLYNTDLYEPLEVFLYRQWCAVLIYIDSFFTNWSIAVAPNDILKPTPVSLIPSNRSHSWLVKSYGFSPHILL